MARSRAYPISPLQTAIEDLEKLDREIGRGRHDREAVGHALGYKSGKGAAARKVAALVHYGLVDRHKDEYAVSDSADEVLHSTTSSERSNALRNAFLSVPLFAEVIEKYRGDGRLPGQLPNLLYRHHGITAVAKEEVAEILRSSARTAGLIDEQGRFINGEPESSPHTEQPKEDADSLEDEPNDDVALEEMEHAPPRSNFSPPPKAHRSADSQVQRVTLTHGWAELSLPAQLTARDLKKLRKLIEVVALDIEDEEEPG